MAFFNINEFVDIVVMSLILGYIFKDFFGPKFYLPSTKEKMSNDPVAYYRNMGKLKQKEGFKTAILVAAPAVILHEIGHKLVAIHFGLTAEFHAAYFWLMLAVLLKIMNFGFIFFVPAYVSIMGKMTPLQGSATAFAGPAVNLALFLIIFGLVRNKVFSKKYRKYLPILVMTYRINFFLFIFNMLPIPMFDGWQVYSGLIAAIF